MASTANKGIYLDVDSSIVEKNLRFAADSNEEELNKLFGPGTFPSKVVKPTPGMCIKTKEVGTDIKVFVNICQTDAIPPPKDITESELEEILDSEDASSFRVPMSIGEVRLEKDKQGKDSKTVDIAIHPKFFEKVDRLQPFRNFFMAIVFQGVEHKHSLVCVDEKIILNNRKAFGTLQMHRIQQREMDEKMGNVAKSNSLIQELTGKPEYAGNKPIIETISSVENIPKVPEYRIYKRKEKQNCLIGEFKLPDVISAKDVTLDIGQDRILLESKLKGYLLDIFIPYAIRQEKTTAEFEKTTKIMTVKMPLLGG